LSDSDAKLARMSEKKIHATATKAAMGEKKKEKPLKKSEEVSEEVLMKAIDAKLTPFFDQLKTLSERIESIANMPLPAKGVAFNQLTPLKKSEDAVMEPLSKTELSDKLFELKKSGSYVDMTDVFKVSTGSDSDRLDVIKKYGIK